MARTSATRTKKSERSASRVADRLENMTRMATKVKAKEKEETEAEREPATDGPLLDLSDDAVKKMIKAAKKRGYVTMDELNAVLPSEEVTSEQIEDTMAMLSDMGINVVDSEEEAEQQEEESKAVATRDEAKPPVTNARED